LQQSVRSGGEDTGFARLRVIALDHANATQRFGQTASDLGVNFGALAEDGPNHLKGTLQNQPEDKQNNERDQRHLDAEKDEKDEREDRRKHSADEIDHARPDKVPHTFHIGHDARDQSPGPVLVVERNRKPPDVGLHLHPKLGDEPLTFLGQKLGKSVRSDALKNCSQHDNTDDDRQQSEMVFLDEAGDELRLDRMLAHHVVDQVLRRGRQNKPAGPVDDHQQETAAKQYTPRLDQLPDLGQHLLQLRFGTRRTKGGRYSTAGTSGRTVGGLHTAAVFGWTERRHRKEDMDLPVSAKATLFR